MKNKPKIPKDLLKAFEDLYHFVYSNGNNEWEYEDKAKAKKKLTAIYKKYCDDK